MNTYIVKPSKKSASLLIMGASFCFLVGMYNMFRVDGYHKTLGLACCLFFGLSISYVVIILVTDLFITELTLDAVLFKRFGKPLIIPWHTVSEFVLVSPLLTLSGVPLSVQRCIPFYSAFTFTGVVFSPSALSTLCPKEMSLADKTMRRYGCHLIIVPVLLDMSQDKLVMQLNEWKRRFDLAASDGILDKGMVEGIRKLKLG